MSDERNVSLLLPMEEWITSTDPTISLEDMEIHKQIEDYKTRALYIWRICSPIILGEYSMHS